MIGFTPIIPQSGYAGWRFFERTQEVQKAVFDNSPEVARDIAYFKENIAKVGSAEALVNDRRLLKVALGAFGLDEDLDKRAYVLKVLSEGTEKDDAFANKLVDKRYFAMAEAFGYGNQFGSRVELSNFASTIVEQYKVRQFEVAVGDADQSVRLAMSFIREISEYSGSDSSEKSLWYKIMGNPPMRQVFETAFGLPSKFGGLDIDQQREVFQERTRKMFGNSSPTVLTSRENVDKLMSIFFIRKQISDNATVNIRGTAALTLLRSSTLAMDNFFQSRLKG